MIVTTGGRSTRADSASLNTGLAIVSSSEWTISTSFPSSAARTWIESSDSVWVRVFISPSAISFFITSGTGTDRYSATSLTVEPELIWTALGSATAVREGRDSASSSYTPRRRRPRRWRRGGWFDGGGPPPPGARGEACQI